MRTMRWTSRLGDASKGWRALAVSAALAGCGGQKETPKAPPEPPKPAAPAAPTPPAPAVPAAPAAPSGADLVAASERAEPAKALESLSALTRHLASNASAADAGATRRALVGLALKHTTAALNKGDAALVKALVGTCLDAQGAPLPGVAGAPDLAEALSLLGGAGGTGMVGLEPVLELATGSSPHRDTAMEVLKVRVGPAVAAVGAGVSADRLTRAAALTKDLAVCAEAKGRGPESCPPAYYGLATAALTARLTREAAGVLRLAVLAKAAGAPLTGVLDLPLVGVTTPATSAPDAARAQPVELVVLNAAGVHLGRRSALDLTGATVLDGGALPGAVVLASDALAKAEKEEELQPLVDAATALRGSVKPLEDKLFGASGSLNAGREKGTWAAALAVAPESTVATLAPVVRSLEKAGFTDLRYVTTAPTLDAIAAPSHVDRIPEARRGRKESRPLLVVVRPDGADVFEPAGGEGEAPKEANAPAVPAETKRWYKGVKLFKLEVASVELAPLVATVRAVRKESGAGSVVLVTATNETKAERLLAVAAALAAAPGPEAQAKLSEVFPGLVCKDEEPTLSKAGCRTLFPVVLPNVAIPTATGLTNEPQKDDKPKKEEPVEKPKKEEEPKAGFCDQGEIKRVITGRMGSFKFCYERKLQLTPELTGKVAVRFTIGADGGVTAASSSGSMPDQSVHECVVKAIKALKFKAPDGGVCTVNYPFMFQP